MKEQDIFKAGPKTFPDKIVCPDFQRRKVGLQSSHKCSEGKSVVKAISFTPTDRHPNVPYRAK